MEGQEKGWKEKEGREGAQWPGRRVEGDTGRDRGHYTRTQLRTTRPWTRHGAHPNTPKVRRPRKTSTNKGGTNAR